jgi:hypothetical protein
LPRIQKPVPAEAFEPHGGVEALYGRPKSSVMPLS